MTRNACDRRLIGYIWDCGDPGCDCRQPLIEEVWIQPVAVVVPTRNPDSVRIKDNYEERRERVWEGTWMAEPASWDMEFLHEELTDACERHNMERNSFDGDVWEREL